MASRGCRWLVLAVLAAGAARAGELADPTRPPDYQPAAQASEAPHEQPVEQWSVAMIRYASKGAVALVNGRAVREGDPLGSARVVRIRPRAIELERDGERFEVRLPGSVFKRPAASAGAQGR